MAKHILISNDDCVNPIPNFDIKVKVIEEIERYNLFDEPIKEMKVRLPNGNITTVSIWEDIE